MEGKWGKKKTTHSRERKRYAAFENLQGMKIDGVHGDFRGVAVESVCCGKWLETGTLGDKC